MKQIVSVVFMAMAVLLGIQVMEAQAQVACCKVQSTGTPIGAESFRCNLSALETRRLFAGQYEVDFTPLSTTVTKFVKHATLDTQAAGFFSGTIGVADRVGDTSSVFVLIQNKAGVNTDAGFILCLY
ncbi:MAG: hypothetical protein AB7P69_26700 [Candidatus Binatia bacterium]